VLVRLALALALLAVAAPRAEAKPSCRSGHTEFTQGHTRILRVHYESDDTSEWFLCSLRRRRPRVVSYGIGLAEGFFMWRQRGALRQAARRGAGAGR
jgi:hypothetical protein